MGLWVVDLLSESQLAAAAERFHASSAQNQQFLVPIALMRSTWANHWHRVMRMPAGGAHAGGSMQTGFEMEMVTAAAASELMTAWPNRQELRAGRVSWEARTMQQAGALLDFGKEPAKWGALNGKPVPPLPGTQGHRGIIIASPPITVTWRSSVLSVRFPITIWMEENAMILPPDTTPMQGDAAISTPFYQDPSSQPGLHRDIFRAWAHKLLGELTVLNYTFTERASAHLTSEYMSDSSCVEEPDERSCSSLGTPDSSEAEGAHQEGIAATRTTCSDSSDEERAHLPGWQRGDSSDEEGAHLPGWQRGEGGGGGGGSGSARR